MSNLQIHRTNPLKPTVVKRHGVWCARAYDPSGNFQIKGELSLSEAYSVALNFAAGDYSKAQQ
ncbi:hypothetical protein [Paenarthrobacter sp. NPDC018779]|uniref:hypothetical protein n=1 Tax=Paenarthrobacter sp. NPDC018779 TaxID=3364375 RepID=UPI0037C77F83